MKLPNCIILIFGLAVAVGCGTEPKAISNESTTTTDSVETEYFDSKDDIQYRERLLRGRDTLLHYLKNRTPDPINFENYHVLIADLIKLNDFERADSVQILIDRNKLDDSQQLKWINTAIIIGLNLKRFDDVMIYLDQRSHYTMTKDENWIYQNDYLYTKWYVHSMNRNCDSAKEYLSLYIQDVEDHDIIRHWRSIDSTKFSHLKNQLKTNCPTMDSVALSSLIFFRWG